MTPACPPSVFHHERTERHSCPWPGTGHGVHRGRGLRGTGNPAGSCGAAHAPWSQVLISSFCFSPQLSELSRTLLRLCPEHRPLWLQPTLLSFKDHRDNGFFSRCLPSVFPGWPLVLTSLLLSVRKIWGKMGETDMPCQPHNCAKGDRRKLAFRNLPHRRRGQRRRPDSIFYGL